MFQTLAVRGLLALALLLALPAAAQVTTWDAARDFSGAHNPNGQWTYGWKASASASLTAFPNYQPTLGAYPGRDVWQDLSRSSVLGVYHNAGSGDIPSNMLLLEPDSGDLAVLGWTAPVNMSVHLQGMFKSLDTGAAQVTIISSLSGTRYSATVNSGASTSSFGIFLNVAAGERIDFATSGAAAGVNVVISQLSVLGRAALISMLPTDTRLRVTTNANNLVGVAWPFTRQRFDDGFDTTFLFSIFGLTGGGADGFSFIIQNVSATAMGAGGGSLGYGGLPSVAVEFDTYLNPTLNDLNGNHISVHTLGINPNSPMETASIGWTTSVPNFKDGQWHLVHLHYAVQPQPELSIYMDNISAPVLRVPVDIVATLQLADGMAWVGFGGGTGGSTEIHDIQNWHFLSYDLHPPVLTLPPNMSMEGDTRGGATVNFTASAVDSVDGSRPVTCTPASGTVFAVGNTTVTCSSTDLSGNTGSRSFQVTVTDTKPPNVVVPLAVTAAARDRNGAPVSYVATANDIVDGGIVPVCSPASASIFPLGKTTVTCTATDHAGNSASQNFNVDVSDQAPPVISGATNLQLEATGPLTTVSWPGVTGTDNVDGNVAVACTPASGAQFAVGSVTVQCTATDAAGNQASASFVVTIQDSTPPAISGMPANMTLEATGPSGAVGTWLSPTAADLADGAVPVTCLPASGSTFPLGITNVACTAADAHGNSTTATFVVKVQDTISPLISCGAPDGLWHAADVTFACTAQDRGTGLANAADASFLLTTSVPAGAETANAATNSRTVCDVAGNCATVGPLAGNAVDKRGPTVTITSPANTVYLLHQPVAASYACADGGSGVAACNGTVANGMAIDTESVGARQFTVNAGDKVGNVSTASVSYSVGYNLCRLDSPGPKQSGSTIPVRLELCDYAGRNVSAPALSVMAAGVVGAGGATTSLRAAGAANSGMRFRYLGDRPGGAYMFDLKTSGLAPGLYELLVVVPGDPSPHTVPFRIGHKEDATH